LKRLSAVLILIFLTVSYQARLFSGDAAYEIKDLSPSDSVFMKFVQDIKANYAEGKELRDDFDLVKLQAIKRLSIAIYRVKKEDTIFSIAEKMGMVVDTLISFNSLASNYSLNEGDELMIPNMDGIVLFPSKTVYLEKVSKIYQLPIELLMYINNIQRKYVYAKEEVFIPFARMTEEEKGYFQAKLFTFPLRGGRFTSGYGLRVDPFTSRWTFHGGVDIATPRGTKVYASANATVKYVGWGKGYGKLVVLKHKYGYTSWYGHLSEWKVKKGDAVKQGQLIALSGNTGRSTGPHLHYEVRRFNLRKNPLEVLDFNHITNK